MHIKVEETPFYTKLLVYVCISVYVHMCVWAVGKGSREREEGKETG